MPRQLQQKRYKMGTWKRPLAEGQVCEDQRAEFNPKLGRGKVEAKAEAVEEIAVEAEAEVPVQAEVKVPKGKKAKEEAVTEEAPVALEDEAVLDEAEATEVVEAE